MAVTALPKILDNITASYTPEGSTADEVPVSLNAAHLENLILNADSDAPASLPVVREYTLDGSGELTIDMRALVGAFGEAVDGNGKKIQWIHFVNAAGNSDLEISTGATNGLVVPGGSFTVPGAADEDTHDAKYWPNVLTNIDATHKTWDCVGGIDESFTLALVIG